MKHHWTPLLLLPLLALVAAAPAATPPPQRPVDLRAQVQALQAEVDDLKERVAQLEALLASGSAGAKAATPAGIDLAEVRRAAQEGRICLGMTKEQARGVLGNGRIEAHYDSELGNGRAAKAEWWTVDGVTRVEFAGNVISRITTP